MGLFCYVPCHLLFVLESKYSYLVISYGILVVVGGGTRQSLSLIFTDSYLPESTFFSTGEQMCFICFCWEMTDEIPVVSY